MHKPALELEDLGVSPSHKHRYFFERLEARVPDIGVVEVLDVGIEVLLQLLCLEVVVSHEVGVHLDQVVPVDSPDAHGDEVWSMPARSVWYGCCKICHIEIERLGGWCLERGLGFLDWLDWHCGRPLVTTYAGTSGGILYHSWEPVVEPIQRQSMR